MRQVWRVADRLAQRRGEHQTGVIVVAGASGARPARRTAAGGRPSRAARGFEQRQQRGDRDIGLDREVQIDRRQALVIHAPAVMDAGGRARRGSTLLSTGVVAAGRP